MLPALIMHVSVGPEPNNPPCRRDGDGDWNYYIVIGAAVVAQVDDLSKNK